MKQLYNLPSVSHIRWGHAVNTREYLNELLGKEHASPHFLEADVRTNSSDPSAVIMAHDEADHGDSFEDWLSYVLYEIYDV